jgi:hypothetical protein
LKGFNAIERMRIANFLVFWRELKQKSSKTVISVCQFQHLREILHVISLKTALSDSKSYQN